MADRKTIARAFNKLLIRFPAYMEKNKDKLQSTMNMWVAAFKETPDDVLLKATEMIIESDQAYFPNTAEVEEKVRRAVLINNQKIVTYQARLGLYLGYTAATPEEIDAWVDLHRAIHTERGWTTKDFKETVKLFKDQLNEAIRELPEAYKKANRISEV